DGLALSLPARFDLPVALQFPQRASLLIQAGPDGRAAGVAALQQTVLRLLTSFPAGKVRFTLIDPVGLGQSFAGFMHLSDYEQAIVGDKIWTEPRHIEQKLTDLTEHMEDVIQKYLRNEYESIDAYNAQAGEVAEPYRFLVLADFPTNLTDQAAKRLASIIASGPRCGVYTLILADARHKPPPGLHMADLEKAAGVRLVYRAGRFVREDGGFNGLELSLDAPPPEQAFTDLIHRLGESLKDSTRVQVPFATVAPGPGEQWSLASDRDVTVPIGRAGATKLQHLTLGKGTAQHALIAGRTGSGKSTLLHAIITSAALWYAPGQVELYLVDFKKGVEFKTYVTHALPHARVIAIESEREFGLSVLRRLDAELKRRGNLYRDLNVQDLAGFRQAAPGTPMPRVLLIVDEFQELFVEDDKIAQEATLLLDRLVRQGRAFGMHVVLGSQTLGGAYSLARSTIGQMAVRIALQCSEADAYLIMSDDNSAPRLLSRPGEAIYNDASGAVEGNSPFQVVWLPDEQRDDFLGRVRAEARARPAPAEPPIVFEGNVPADVSRLAPLAALLEAPAPPEAAPAAPRLWLGEPVSIKEATASVFRRQSGTNTLIVGQKDESALAMIAVGMIGLAAQEPPSPPGAAEMLCPRFVVLDGTPTDEPGAGLLASIGAWLPQGALCPEYREATDAVARVHAELQRRKAADTGAAPARAPGLYLFIHGLQRFRALRKKEDEFGFSDAGDAAAPAPDRMFAEILSDGPALGVHTVAWCDTVTNLDRTLSRQSLREFDVRVLFQMSPTDSSALIDGPAAGLIGQNRALFHSEEQGVLEKFRPWAVPSESWLARARHALSARTAGV
ncbi:MAG: AAA family ATPase, partial [Phycisphaeraceae bacterium]|nr:AAA family ATPase [Phycisphaeraceae bacterium]